MYIILIVILLSMPMIAPRIAKPVDRPSAASTWLVQHQWVSVLEITPEKYAQGAKRMSEALLNRQFSITRKKGSAPLELFKGH